MTAVIIQFPQPSFHEAVVLTEKRGCAGTYTFSLEGSQAIAETKRSDDGADLFVIDGPTQRDVQYVITHLMTEAEDQGNTEAVFYNPYRIGNRWHTTGFVRSLGEQEASA